VNIMADIVQPNCTNKEKNIWENSDLEDLGTHPTLLPASWGLWGRKPLTPSRLGALSDLLGDLTGSVTCFPPHPHVQGKCECRPVGRSEDFGTFVVWSINNLIPDLYKVIWPLCASVSFLQDVMIHSPKWDVRPSLHHVPGTPMFLAFAPLGS
jgi:hypothetical protein